MQHALITEGQFVNRPELALAKLGIKLIRLGEPCFLLLPSCRSLPLHRTC
jgi:hypothetical protein